MTKQTALVAFPYPVRRDELGICRPMAKSLDSIRSADSRRAGPQAAGA